MITRWLIRSFFIALLVVCVAAWVGSYWRFCMFAGPSGGLTEASGLLYVGFGKSGFAKWTWTIAPADARGADSLKITYEFSKYHYAGFAFDPASDPEFLWLLIVPLWFPTLLSALLLLLVWRKTRPKPIGHAFPIEPTAKPK